MHPSVRGRSQAHGVGALGAILDKAATQAAARKIDQSVLLAARLYPDMLPFVRQVQIAGDFAKGTVARLAARDIPVFADDETSVADLKARLERTLAFVNEVPASEIDGSETRSVTITPGGHSLTFTGQNYLTQFALPNFYFHLTTAYAILRHNGIEIGKRDFLGVLEGQPRL